MRSPRVARPLLAFLVGALPATLAAQDTSPEISGRVILEGWAEVVPEAGVLLLDEDYGQIATTTAGFDGSFLLRAPGPGTYFLQARHGNLAGAPVGPVELEEGAVIRDFFLELPSRLLRDALDCFATMRDETTGVLAGVVYEPATDTPLPGAQVTLQWTNEEGERQVRNLTANLSGRFVACGVPGGVPMTAWVQSMGVVSTPHPDIVVEELGLARHDLTLDLSRSQASVRIRTGDEAPGLGDGPNSVVTGRLLDQQSGRPVAAAIVTLGETGRQDLTDGQGRFRFSEVEPGAHEIGVRHMAYGEHSERLDVVGSSEVEVELRLTPQAIALEEITVRARTARLPTRVAGARPSRTLEAERLERMEERGTPLYQALYEIPGLRMEYFRQCRDCPVEVCVESSRGRFGMKGVCEPVEVFIDGSAIPLEDLNVLRSLFYGNLNDYERIEFLGPSEAIRWGFRANQAGALFLWTKRGPRDRGR